MLHITLFRARQQLFDGQAAEVVLPGAAGDVSVLPYHAPMLCALAPGEICVDQARFAVRSGIAGIERNRITILAE